MRKKIFIFNLILIIIVSLIFIPVSKATAENIMFKSESEVSLYEPKNQLTRGITSANIEGKEFFIKNAYTGQYLDVAGGVAANGTNVQQYKYNGTVSQRWYVRYNGDQTFSLYSRLGGTNVYVYGLDISGGSSQNYANVQIYQINGTDSQKFKIGVASNNSMVFYTKVSNFSKAIVLNGPTLNQGGNIDQYTFQNYVNELWILEPVQKNSTLGVEYAYANVKDSSIVAAYPDFRGGSGNCANFVSQCMLASGIHYQNSSYIYRKGTNLSRIPKGDTNMLNANWELADPSPWISAKQFGRYWKDKVPVKTYKASELIANPSLMKDLQLVQGDVIQYADVGIFNSVGESAHTMYITKVQNSNYYLTYHSGPGTDVDLLSICNKIKDKYIIFYKMM